MKLLLWGLLILSGTACGADWLQWRGPALNGSCDAKNLPTSWSVVNGKNISWTCELPGIGSSTPIVVGQRIFLTAHADDNQLYAICIDRDSGKVDWQKKVGSGPKAMRGNTMASPSAVSDGKTVWFLFGQGSLAAFSLDGKLLWERDLERKHGTFNQKFGFSASPLLHKGLLYIPLLFTPKDDNTGRSLVAIEGTTGKTLWTAERPTQALGESFDSYITPALVKSGVVVTGADLVTCHDLTTGNELWRFNFIAENRKDNWRIISGPVMAEDLAVTAYPRGRTLIALNPDGSKCWDYEGRVPDVCTPAFEKGLLYVLDGVKRYLTCLDAPTGREIWQEKIPSDKGFFASPLVADGKIYLINLAGEVFVYEAGNATELMARIPMSGKDTMASIVAVDDSLYIRTPDRVFRIQNN